MESKIISSKWILYIYTCKETIIEFQHGGGLFNRIFINIFHEGKMQCSHTFGLLSKIRLLNIDIFTEHIFCTYIFMYFELFSDLLLMVK